MTPTPLAKEVLAWVSDHLKAPRREQPTLLMFAGAQGVGKTTALRAVKEAHGARVVTLSLDDFYLPLAMRQRLADEIHPLFETRGPPGTHDLGLLADVIDALITPPGRRVATPVFDKRKDDQLPMDAWRTIDPGAEVIVLEGWLLGCAPDMTAPDDHPLNMLERRHDANGVWRRAQERRLLESYQPIWSRADSFCFAFPQTFDVVMNWRVEQEAEIQGVLPKDLPVERICWVEGFIQYFERLTRRMINGGVTPGRRLAISHDRKITGRSG